MDVVPLANVVTLAVARRTTTRSATTAAAGQTVAVETTAAVEGKPHACRKTGGIMCLMLRDMCVCLNKDLGFMLPNTSLNV